MKKTKQQLEFEQQEDAIAIAHVLRMFSGPVELLPVSAEDEAVERWGEGKLVKGGKND